MFKENKGIDPISNPIIIFALIVIVAVGTLFYFSKMKGGPSKEVEYKTYINKDYGFSLSYPSNWTLDNAEMLGGHIVMLRENISEKRPDAQVRISAGSLGITSLDNVRDQITSSIENNENVALTKGPTDIELRNVPGLDFTLRFTNPQGSFRAREVLFDRENMDCTIYSVVVENSIEDFWPDIEHIFESFNFLKLEPE
ncbi:hypothetical protein AKJ65_04155 [candidate division MSBL1 archaeon SCGC-AAA259E19]|uniref:PsbP C-terminal domain-containing protein n=1 Tax=candidate division MSBL1 archaeon SCGC-AAA259E19 TaxID=1698264 RepID=A0A133UJZ9_9EURY|nr:hypothetical protein AKJ65_04155 [candidate division MSBL1 archaeon SCGC-AAA259E19]